MREIKFRGQTRRKGEYIVNMAGDKCDSSWVYGGIFPQSDEKGFAIIYQQEPEIRKYPVYADTVGQYTGLKDRNGKEIYEGDIVRYTDEVIGEEKADEIEYNETHAAFFRLHKSEMGLQYLFIDEAVANRCEVAGNIFDNPELIGGSISQEGKEQLMKKFSEVN